MSGSRASHCQHHLERPQHGPTPQQAVAYAPDVTGGARERSKLLPGCCGWSRSGCWNRSQRPVSVTKSAKARLGRTLGDCDRQRSVSQWLPGGTLGALLLVSSASIARLESETRSSQRANEHDLGSAQAHHVVHLRSHLEYRSVGVNLNSRTKPPEELRAT